MYNRWLGSFLLPIIRILIRYMFCPKQFLITYMKVLSSSILLTLPCYVRLKGA